MRDLLLLQYRRDVRVLSSNVVTENVLHASVTVSSRVNVVALVSDKVFTRDSRVTSHYTRVLHTRVRRCIKVVPYVYVGQITPPNHAFIIHW